MNLFEFSVICEERHGRIGAARGLQDGFALSCNHNVIVLKQ